MTPKLCCTSRSFSDAVSNLSLHLIRKTLNTSLLAIVLAMPVAAGAMTQSVAFLGEVAPDTNGGTFSTPTLVNLSNTGEVAFFSLIAGSAVTQGLFVGDGLLTRSVALTGQSAPGTGGGVFFSLFRPPQINSSGDVAFYGAMLGGTSPEGLFLETDGVVQPIALIGDPAPGTSEVYFTIGSGIVALNNVGQIATVSGISGFPPTVGVFVESLTGGSLIVLRGDQVPGVAGATFESFGKPSINDTGSVAFEATINTSGGSSAGIFRYTAGIGLVVALENDIAPGTGGGTFGTFEISSSAIDNAGNVYFQARVNGGNTVEGIFVGDGLTKAAILLEGDAVPFPVVATADELDNPPQTSGNGNVAFAADLSLTGAQTERAAFVDAADGSGLYLLASSGDPAPDTGAGTFTGVSEPSVNDAGSIAFTSAISGGTESLGIFVPEPSLMSGLGVGLLTLLMSQPRRRRDEALHGAPSEAR